jgi:hypothetical protein
MAFTGGEEKRALASWDRAHPALAVFDGRDGGDLRELEWRDGFEAPASSGWRELAVLDGGHPVLLQKQSAQPTAGPVLVCAHPLNREWTDIPRAPLFVPLMKNLFTALGRVESAAAEARVLSPGAREQRPIGDYIVGKTVEVVAADGGEAFVATAGDTAFRAAFGLPIEDAVAVAAAVPEQAAERSRPGEFWPWLLLGLLIILAVENVVATRNPPVAVSPS